MTSCHWACVTSYLPRSNGLLITTLWAGFSSGRSESDPIMNSPAGMCTNSISTLLRRVANDGAWAGICVAGGYTPTATWGPNGCCPPGAGDCGVVPSLLAVPDDG